jgi:hypothetical protein
MRIFFEVKKLKPNENKCLILSQKFYFYLLFFFLENNFLQIKLTSLEKYLLILKPLVIKEIFLRLNLIIFITFISIIFRQNIIDFDK